MRSTVTGLELRETPDDKMELSQATGERIKTSEDIPLTQQDSGREVKKSSAALWPSISGEPVQKSEGDGFECFVPFCKADAARQIVYGVIYEPDKIDSQGDEANAAEIELAAHDFLKNSRVLKLMHKGKQIAAEIVESYISPDDFELGGQKVTKGSWVAAVHVSDAKLWKAIVDKKLTGFSMAGTATEDAA